MKYLYRQKIKLYFYSEFPVKMGNSNSLPEIPGGGTDGYHVLRVQV